MKWLVLVLFLAGFHQPASFEAPAADGGGNRMYFAGSPRQKSYDCSACHDAAAHAITATIDGLPEAYTPGAAYTLTVRLAGEHEGAGAANNQNGFLAEIVDDARAVAGTLATPDVDRVELVDDGRVAAGEGRDATAWTFAWTAPPAGTGAVTLHLAMVDGNGAASVQVPQNDPGGDDVAVAHVRMCESARGCPDASAPATTESVAAGCSAGGSPGIALVLLVLVALLRRRRRAALLACTLAGCFDAATPADCPDHVCGSAGTVDAGAACAERWVCTPWEAAAGGNAATRTCTDRNAAGSRDCMPPTSATLPALDLDYYKCRVSPIFQRGCAQLACHGTDTEHPFRIYARGRLRNKQMVFPVNTCGENPSVKVDLQQRGTATVMCEGWSKHTPEEWQKSFDSARSFMLDVASPDDSLILREAAKGGLPHAQVKLFAPGDADYETIHSWLAGARLGTTCNTGAN